MTERSATTMARVRVRPLDAATMRDYRNVRLAMLLDQPLAYGSTYAREAAFGDQDWEARLRTGHTWLAYDGDLPIGSVTLAQPDDGGDASYLVAMWVAAHARGGGVADALVQALVDHARAAGIGRVVLDVAQGNVRATRFYERIGFTRTGRTGRLPHQDEVVEVELERVLA